MTTKQRWLTLGLLVLGVGGLAGYYFWPRAVRPVTELIPPDALLVIQSSELHDPLPATVHLRETYLRSTPLFAQAALTLDRLFWQTLDTAATHRLLRGKSVWYSLHPSSRFSREYLFFVPVQPVADQALVDRLLHPDPNRFRVLSHPSEGERIYELLTVGNQSLGSFVLLDNHLVGSTSTVLIEQVLRRRRQPFTASLPQFERTSGVRTQFFVRQEGLKALLPPGKPNELPLASFLPAQWQAQLYYSADSSHLIASAAEPINLHPELAGLFTGQLPGRVACGAYVPAQTTQFVHLRLSDAGRYGSSLDPVLEADSLPTIRQQRNRLLPLLRNQQRSPYPYVGQEIALCQWESPTGEPRRVMLVQSTNAERLLDRYLLAAILLQGPASVQTNGASGSLAVQQVRTYDLPTLLFGPLFRGFREHWVTHTDTHLLIANRPEALQEYNQALRTENVWASDRRLRKLLEETLRPATLTLFSRPEQAGTDPATTLPVAWRRLRDADAAELPENLVFQSSFSRERLFSHLLLGRSSQRASGAVYNRLLLHKKIDFNAPLISSPLVVGDFTGGSGQVWVVNGARQFVLITPEGEKKVLDSLDGPIRSRVVPVTVFPGSSPQFAFATDRRLYLAEQRLGLVRLRSLALPTGTEPASLVSLRGQDSTAALLLAHQDGSVYALDRKRRQFVLRYRTQTPGQGIVPVQTLLRRQGLAVVSQQQEGSLHLWTADGTPAPGFPRNLSSEFSGPTMLEGSATGQSGRLTTLTRQGELIRLQEDGTVESRKQFYRPIRRGSFRLLPDENQKEFVLLRYTDTEAVVLDTTGRALLEVRGLPPGQTQIRYHVLTTGLRLISVKTGNFTSLYDLRGQAIGDRPVPSPFPVELQFDPGRNKLFVYSCTEKAVQVWSIKLR